VAPGDPLSVLFDAGRESGEFRRLRRLQRKSGFYGVLRRIGLGIKTKPSLRGNNMSAHVPDLRSVNGFDEEYVGWGQEDDDLGRRLYRLGVRPVVLVSRALAVHLGHGVRKTGSWQDGPNVARFHRRDLPARCAMGMDGKRPDVVVRRYPGRVG
jgi:GT2 family glycosyltransferase